MKKFYIENLLEPSHKSWKINEIDDCVYLTAPNGTSFTILLNDPIDFSQDFELQPQSARMWLWSLGYLPLLKNINFKRKIINEFLIFIQSELWGILCLKSSSMDHCAAIRIRSLCHEFNLDDSCDSYLGDIKKIVSISCEYALAPGNLIQNNHGMMLSFALLHAVEIFDLDQCYCDIANNFLKILFSEVFDRDGMSNENTIGYHDFYCKTLAQLHLFLSNFSDDLDFIKYIDDLHNKAKVALYKCVWPDGGLPPIGESSAYPTKYSSINGVHYFKESGLFVRKNEKFYFSVVCGSRGETHKQMDDGSFTLKYKGVLFITDGGLYNYDRHDPFRRHFNSQRSHSGFYFSEFDNLISRP